ncbi:MAG TPA: hypothetical protein PLN45_02755 [Exilispira sp.]|nr:hypothetical protein [Exilispira sp.]
MRVKKNIKLNSVILFSCYLFIFLVLLLLFLFQPICAQNLPSKYFEIWNKYSMLDFYNEINKDSIQSYNYFYIVYYDSKNRILRFEYSVKGKIEFSGEIAYYTSEHATITLKKLEIPLMGTLPVLTPYALYDIVFLDDKISNYTLYKVSSSSDKPIKIGDARFTYRDNLLIIENIFNGKVVNRIEQLTDEKGNLIEQKFYNEKNLVYEVKTYLNNRINQRIVYKYDPSGKLTQTIIYDAFGNIISTENH